MTLKLNLATMTAPLRRKKTFQRTYFWRLTLMKQAHLIVKDN